MWARVGGFGVCRGGCQACLLWCGGVWKHAAVWDMCTTACERGRVNMCRVPGCESGPGDERPTARKVEACTAGLPSCPKGSTLSKGYVGVVVWP